MIVGMLSIGWVSYRAFGRLLNALCCQAPTGAGVLTTPRLRRRTELSSRPPLPGDPPADRGASRRTRISAWRRVAVSPLSTPGQSSGRNWRCRTCSADMTFRPAEPTASPVSPASTASAEAAGLAWPSEKAAFETTPLRHTGSPSRPVNPTPATIPLTFRVLTVLRRGAVRRPGADS